MRRNKSQFNDFSLPTTTKLIEFSKDIDNIILNTEQFNKISQEEFFKTYIKTINFLPTFNRFGLGKYYLYLCPTNWDDVDLKLMCTNTFQSIQYPANISSN